MTLDHEILQSLQNAETRDAHRLYDAAISFVAWVDLSSPAVLRAVADRLSAEVQRTREPNEIAMMLAMVAFLAHESDGR